MKVSTLLKTASKLLAVILLAMSAINMVTALPTPKTSTANPTASFEPTNLTTLIDKRNHKSAHYYLSVADHIFLSEDEEDFVPGSIREVEPMPARSGALYRDIKFFQRGDLRLKGNHGKKDVIIPNVWFCNKNSMKKNPGGCYGRNFIDPRPERLAMHHPNLKIRYEDDFAIISSGNDAEVVFDKVNDESGRGHYRYRVPGSEPFDREKWEKEKAARPACNRKGDMFGFVDTLCDEYEKFTEKQEEAKYGYGYGYR